MSLFNEIEELYERLQFLGETQETKTLVSKYKKKLTSLKKKLHKLKAIVITPDEIMELITLKVLVKQEYTLKTQLYTLQYRADKESVVFGSRMADAVIYYDTSNTMIMVSMTKPRKTWSKLPRLSNLEASITDLKKKIAEYV